MASIITHGSDTIYPTVIDGWSSTRTRPNRVKLVLGTERADVTLKPAGLRTGQLKLVFGDRAAVEGEYIIVDGMVVWSGDLPGVLSAEEASAEAERLHATGNSIFTLTDGDRPSLLLYYVVADNGTIRRELDGETRDVWVVTVDFQEVDI